ncbi:tetratricopeptide repeat protein [Nocardiopsis alba]|uniref:tetratricopeptide repeat protein n=1 Tax=Nocardiopsis alba TaxID=53437 RepID=UPI0033DB6A1C
MTASTSPTEPRQLPPPSPFYVRRSSLERRIETAVERAHLEGRNALVVITGPAGVGKSALAARFLHDHPRLAGGGHFFVDLQGFTPGPPTDPHRALEGLLHSLGTEPKFVPTELQERAAWWRSATTRLRVALLLDDALSAAQVRVLLPGGAGHTIVVTSRVRLTALRLDGAVIVQVPPLETEEAVELLRRSSGEETTDGMERDAMRKIASLCGGFPVALCTVALAESDEKGGSWVRLEDELRTAQERLARLNSIGERIGVEVSLRGAFDLSYESLAPEQARTYRRLAWHPGVEITPLIASRLTGDALPKSEKALRDLARQHLLIEQTPGRYRFHDLLRLHAEEKAAEYENDEAKEEGIARLARTFAELSIAADIALRPYVTSRIVKVDPAFADAAQAARWLDAEKGNLVDLIDLAGRHDLFQETLWLTEGLWSLFLHHGQAHLWLRAGEAAVLAARRSEDERTLGRLLNKRALVHSHLGRVEEAMADLAAAEEIWSRREDWKRVAQTRQRRGTLALEHGDLQEAVGFLEDALAADEHTGAEHHRAVTLFLLGRAHLATGSPEKALGFLERALPPLENSLYNRARARIALGSALLALSRPEEARREVEAALREMVEHGSGPGQSEAWDALGEIHEHQGDLGAARTAYENALESLDEKDPARRRVQERLDGSG